MSASKFTRSALFPLIVIVLLVYLASQTLLADDTPRSKVPYSEVAQMVRTEPDAIKRSPSSGTAASSSSGSTGRC
jgi:hypothetical protein